MTTKRGNFHLPHDVWNDRAEKLLQHMIFSMVLDVEMNKKTSRDEGRLDLENFGSWPVYIRAIDCGMIFPRPEGVKRYLKNGMHSKRRRFFIGTPARSRRDYPAHNRLPVGSIRKRGGDSKYIKIAQPDKWQLIPKHERGTVGKSTGNPVVCK